MSLAKVVRLEQSIERVAAMKQAGKRVVFTNGCFDLLHPGHIRYLVEARRLGDALVVAINSDRSVQALKGPSRPILPESERGEVMAALRCVDLVTIFDEATPRNLLARMLPQVLVKGGDWELARIVGREEVEAAGGVVMSIPVVPGFSTSEIVRKAGIVLSSKF